MVPSIKLPQTTAMILAGGRVGELSVLTLDRPKSALPFAGYFRIIDFPLSNVARAGIQNAGILSQYRPASLIDHIGVGASWDLIGYGRGAKILPPYHAAEGSDWYRGNADAVLQNLRYLRDRETEIALILSGDHIYSMDYRELILHHLEKSADLTIAFKRFSHPDRRFGFGQIDKDGRLTGYEEKPAKPASNLASLTIYVFNMKPLTQVLSGMRDHDSIEFGRDVIPAMLADYRVQAFLFDGYWAYTRTVDAYYEAHEDLLAGKIDLQRWGVRTNHEDSTLVRQTPPIFRSWTEAEGSLISEGCIVEGCVQDSVLGPGVRVRKGAVVASSILFNNVVVEEDARVCNAIVDKRAVIGRQASIGGNGAAPAGDGPIVSRRGIALIGKGARLAPSAVVPAGGIVNPSDRLECE
jgi:glucose-1-phosphate adenylyltransferase